MVFCLLGVLLLSGCGSEFTNIQAPPEFESGDTVEIEITHTFNDESSPSLVPGEEAAADDALVFTAIIPDDWTPEDPAGSYMGTWDSTVVDLEVSVFSGPPETNLIEWAVETDAPPPFVDIFEALDCEEAPPVPGPGQQLVWYRTETTPDGLSPVAGDFGTLTLGFVAGANTGGPKELTFQHAILAFFESDGEVSLDEDLSICTFYVDMDETTSQDIFPDTISAVLRRPGIEGTPAPIPTLGRDTRLLALVALLLVVAGVALGRRGQRHNP